MLDKERILSGFRTLSLQHRVEIIDRVDSTNKRAKELLSQINANDCIVIATEQTLGRGRLNRTWYSPKGGLYFSMIIKTDTRVKSCALYGLMAACAIHEALKVEIGLQTHLKWPNDLLVDTRKLSGILSELVVQGQNEGSNFVILGIGINVNTLTEEFPEDLREIVTSIRTERGCDTPLEDLLVAIVSRIDWWLQTDPSLTKVFYVYNKVCGTVGSEVLIELPEMTIQGLAKGIDEYGHLLVQDVSGRTHMLDFGDVVYLRSM